MSLPHATAIRFALGNEDTSDWTNQLTYSDETSDGQVTFYTRKANGEISLAEMVTYKLDKTPATGAVAFTEQDAWKEFISDITFHLFYKDEVTVKAEATDERSGVASIEYMASDKAMKLAEIEAVNTWTAIPEKGVGVSIEDTKQFVYYIRIFDIAGNVTYLSTNGAEYDITNPVISGAEDGSTYYTTQVVTATDKNLMSITVNGDEVSDVNEAIILDGDKDIVYTIVATDKAGNATTVTVTMKPISDLSQPIDDLSKENVKSDNEQTVDDVKASVEAVDTTNATDAEKEALNAITDKATELEQVIDDTRAEITRINEELGSYDSTTVNSGDVAGLEQLGQDMQALTDADNLTEDERKALEEAKTTAGGLLETIQNAAEAIDTENTQKVGEVTADNVTPENKTDLENAKADLEKALEEKGSNYTEDEKKAIEEEISRIEGALEIIGNVEVVEEQINDLPNKITLDDEEAIKAADEAYNALSDYEKSLVDKDVKKALDEAKEALEELKKEAASPVTGDNSNLWLWLVLALISGMGIVGVYLKKRKMEDTL